MNTNQDIVNDIRDQYTKKEHSMLDELKRLDAKVKRPVIVFAYGFGTISALVMGAGMSLIMTDLYERLGLTYQSALILGTEAGGSGIVFASLAYPVYH